MAVETRDLTPRDFPLLERLFGPNGACAGCWCMWWRLGRGETLRDVGGEPLRRRQKALVERGASLGVLAFAGGEPVGWCAYGPKADFPVLLRSRKLGSDNADDVWSVNCFFIKAGWRGRGVARALLRHALRSIRRRGGRVVEGYPVEVGPSGRAANAAAFTGTVPFFASEGFERVGPPGVGKQPMRRRI